MKCSLCDVNEGNEGTGLCDRCWELKTRIEANVELAQEVLKNNEYFKVTITKEINSVGRYRDYQTLLEFRSKKLDTNTLYRAVLDAAK